MLNIPSIECSPLDTYTNKPEINGHIFGYQHPTYGFQIVRLVYNDSSATISRGQSCTFDAGSILNVTKSTAAVHARYALAGIAQCDIPDERYAFVVVWGLCYCLGVGNGDPAADALLITDATTAGSLDDDSVSTNEHCIVGKSKTAAAATSPYALTADIRLLS